MTGASGSFCQVPGMLVGSYLGSLVPLGRNLAPPGSFLYFPGNLFGFLVYLREFPRELQEPPGYMLYPLVNVLDFLWKLLEPLGSLLEHPESFLERPGSVHVLEVSWNLRRTSWGLPGVAWECFLGASWECLGRLLQVSLGHPGNLRSALGEMAGSFCEVKKSNGSSPRTASMGSPWYCFQGGGVFPCEQYHTAPREERALGTMQIAS